MNNDPNSLVTVLEFDDSQEEQAAQKHRRRMEAMQDDSARSAKNQTRSFETMHERLVAMAERTAERHRRLFDAVERAAAATERGIGKMLDMGGRAVVKTAELVGAVGLLTVTTKQWFNHLRDGEVEMGRHSLAVNKLVDLYRVARIALSPTFLTAGMLTGGIVVEHAIASTVAQAKQIQSDAFLAARSGRSFGDVSVIGLAGELSGQGRGQFQSIFGKKTPSQIIDLVDDFKELKDPVEKAAFAVKNFGDNAEKALPLLRDRLKENIERAYELQEAFDPAFRQRLDRVSEGFRRPIEEMREMQSAARKLKDEVSNIAVRFTVTGAEAFLAFTDLRPGEESYFVERQGVRKGRVPSDFELSRGALEAATERADELQRKGTAPLVDSTLRSRSMRAIDAYRNDRSLEGLRRRLGEAESRREQAMRQFDMARGTPLETTVGNRLLAANSEVQSFTGSIRAAERTARSWDEALRASQSTIERQISLQQSATSKMFEGAITNSRAGQYNTGVPSFASEALQGFDLANITGYTLPNGLRVPGLLASFGLPRRPSADQRAADLLEFQGVRQDVARAEDERRLAMLDRQRGLEERLISLQGTDARRVIEDTYTLRVNRANEVYEIERRIVGDTLAGYKQVDALDEARVQRTEELARLQRERFDGIKREAAGLYETLFTHPPTCSGQS